MPLGLSDTQSVLAYLGICLTLALNHNTQFLCILCELLYWYKYTVAR